MVVIGNIWLCLVILTYLSQTFVFDVTTTQVFWNNRVKEILFPNMVITLDDVIDLMWILYITMLDGPLSAMVMFSKCYVILFF